MGGGPVAPNSRKAKLEMLADFLREVAVLLAVFVPLEFYLKGQFSASVPSHIIIYNWAKL